MSDDKQYKVTEEIRDLWNEYIACIGCRDKCIDSIFKSKRAISYGKSAEKAKLKFWVMLRDLHPEIGGRPISYCHEKGVATIAKDDES